MQRHRQRFFPQFLIFIKSNGKFEDAVVQKDRRERIDMLLRQVFRAEGFFQLTVEPQSREDGVIHVISEAFRLGWLVPDDVLQVFRREGIGFPQLPGNIPGQQISDACKALSGNFFKMLLCFFAQRRQAFEAVI